MGIYRGLYRDNGIENGNCDLYSWEITHLEFGATVASRGPRKLGRKKPKSTQQKVQGLTVEASRIEYPHESHHTHPSVRSLNPTP